MKKWFQIHLSPLACACLLLAAGQIPAAQTNFPADAGLINVKAAPYNAYGDGIHDDTAVILQAIRNANASTSSGKIIYFPNGTYLVSNTLDWKNAAGNWCCSLSFRGQERALTTIKLANGAAGFDNPAAPKAIIYTASIPPHNNVALGDSEQAFNNHIMNLTIDVGQNNPGAAGIDYLANNVGSVRDVTIKSSDPTRRGYAGLLMKRNFPGPCLISNVSIDGFSYGINIDGFECGVTFEHITLTNQSVAGILNSENLLSIRDLRSTNSVVAISNTTSNGLIVLVGGSLTGGSSGISAISNGGKVLLRDVTSSGYSSVIAGQGTFVSEYASQAVEHAFTDQQLSSLRLPIEEPPAAFHSNTMSDWANIVTYGAVSGSGDDSAAIQAAMNSGKPMIYFPSGFYHVGGTITVPATVKTIHGLSSTLTKTGTLFNDSANPQDVFRVQEASSSPLTIQGFWVQSIPGGIILRHKANRVVAVKDCEGWMQADTGAGKLFLEDVCITLRQAANTNVWARQLDMETTLAPAMAINDGGNLWVLGIKSEKPNTIVKTINGGATEILGGMLSLNAVQPTTLPAFLIENSRGSFSYGERTYNSSYTFTTHVSETRGTTTQNILRTDLPSRGTGKMMVLGSAFQGTGNGLPAPWQTQDIGAVGLAGSASYSGGTFTVAGSGADIWYAADAFRYVYQAANGDCEIKARVVTQTNTAAWAKSGVMIRETLAANSTNSIMLVSPTNGLSFDWRSTTGGNSFNAPPVAGAVPYWVRVVRAGNTFTGYRSTDGTTWIQTGTVNIAMGANVYIGLAVCAHSNTARSTATFDNVAIVP